MKKFTAITNCRAKHRFEAEVVTSDGQKASIRVDADSQPAAEKILKRCAFTVTKIEVV